MYSFSCDEEVLITKLCSMYKSKIQKIFNTEINYYSFGKKYTEAQNVFINKDDQYGYYGKTDFKWMAIVMKKGINHLQIIQEQNEKLTFQKFLLYGTKIRNEVWHNKINLQNIQSIYYDSVQILKKIWEMTKKNYSQKSKIFSNHNIEFIDALLKQWGSNVSTKTNEIQEPQILIDENIKIEENTISGV